MSVTRRENKKLRVREREGEKERERERERERRRRRRRRRREREIAAGSCALGSIFSFFLRERERDFHLSAFNEPQFQNTW